MVHFPSSRNKTCKFNTMLITPPPPSSEPPPPYSPPRNTSCTSSRQSNHGLSPNTHFPFFPSDLSLAKKARAALNHGPSSAFHPPPSKGKILGEPPPYSLTDNTNNSKLRYDMELRDLKARQSVEKCDEVSSLKSHLDSCDRDFFQTAGQTLKTPRELYQHTPARVTSSTKQATPNVTPSNQSNERSHPQGPLLRTGKSLQIPGSRGTLRHHPQATTHQHPSPAHIPLESRERQHRQTYSTQSPHSLNSSHFHQANRGASLETRSYDGSGKSPRYKLQNIVPVPLGSPPAHALHIARPYHLQPQGQSPRGTLAGTSITKDSHQHLAHSDMNYPSRYDSRPSNSNHLTGSNSDDTFHSFNVFSNNKTRDFHEEHGYRDDSRASRNKINNRQVDCNKKSGYNALLNDIPFSDSEDGSRRSHRSRLSRFVEHISRDEAADRDLRRKSAHNRPLRTARLEQEAANSMICARAFPALVTTPRMRSCRSLDELSDLLHDDLERFDESSVSPLPSIARSLDDLTEPLYMNVPLRNTLPASHSLNTSVPDVLDPPPLPAKPKRGRTISLSPITIRDEMTSLQEQLEKIKQVAFVLGNKVERGEFTSTLSSNSSRPSQHPSPRQYPSVSQGHNSAFKRIVPSNTSSNNPRLTSQRLDPPGVPSRAPVINDVSFLLNQEATAKFNISDPTASQGYLEADVDAEVNAADYQRQQMFSANQSPEHVSLSFSRTPDPDSSSHESGYSSTDSRSGATRRSKLSPEELTDFNINAESQSSEQCPNPRTHSDRFLERHPHQSTPLRHQPQSKYPMSNVPDLLRREAPVLPPRGSPPSTQLPTPLGPAACTLPQQRSSRDAHYSGEYRRVRSTSGSRVDEPCTRNSRRRDESPEHHSPRHHSMDYLQENSPRKVSKEPKRLSRNHIERFENPDFWLDNGSSHHFNNIPTTMSTHNKLYGSMDQLRADLEYSRVSQDTRSQISDQESSSMSFARDSRLSRDEGLRHCQIETKPRDDDRIKLNSRRSCPPELPKKLRSKQLLENEGLNQDQLGIYIKSVVPGGSADQDGRLQAGDQLLSVDGRSLVGISQERAAEYMKRTGPTVVLEVARQGAFYHGLATVLEQPSPQGVRPPVHGAPVRPSSERDIPSKLPPHPLMRGPPPAAHLQPRMQPAKSVPALNSELSLSGELSKSTSNDQSLLPPQPPHHPQDIFNPNYSRTSSSNSLTPHHTTLSNSMAPPASSQNPPHHLQHQPPHGSQMLPPPPPHQHQPMPLRSRSTQNLSENDDRHYQNISFHAAPPHRSPHGVQPPPQLREHPAHQPRPASALLQRDEPGRADPSFRPDLYRPASQRDLRPQEPRLVHLPEEGPNGQVPMPSMRHPPPLHQQSPGGGSGGGFTPTKQAPPPTAPKPKPMDRNGQQPHAFRPPIREEGNGYRDSPPPPPPPTSTHPLLQGSSSNEPTTRQPFFSKTSAWEREEKERYEKRRREAARQWRDEQISQLERQPHKTPQEEERLKTLQLEREFELRAKQADEEDDNSEDEEEERITSMAPDNRTDEATIDRREAEKEAIRGGVPRGGPGFLSGQNGGGPADEERAKRADEIRRKQQELEVASEVEQKLLREAQRRQEEEANARRYQQQQYQQFKNNPQQASQRLDSLVGAAPNNEFNSNGPMNGLRTSNSFDQQNFNNGNINPPPPERNSSYNVMQHQQQQQQHQQHQQHQQQQQQHQYQQQYPSTNNARVRNTSMDTSPPSAANMAPVKRVQFSESPHTSTTSVLDVSSSSTVSFDANANKEDRSPTKYNPNDFINEAENMLNFSPSPIRNPGSAPATPGVIGAQEVYRDPRVKRLQEKQALQAASSNRPPVPETLTFREKMKMFAAETGEPETPKDRTKISRAQRDID